MRRRAPRAGGFTLLEIMIAMAILSGGLVWLVVGVTRNIKAENHAKLMTTATFLARQQMVELEDDLYLKGFGEFEKDTDGNFEDKGFARFHWKTIVDKVDLPSSEQVQTMLTGAQQAKQQLQTGTDPSQQSAGGLSQSPFGGLTSMFGGGASSALGGSGSSGDSSANPLSASAGMLGSQYGLIKEVIQQALRRVTIQVSWYEGTTPQMVELMAYYTDVRAVDQAIQISNAAANGQNGSASSSTGSTTSTSTTSTGK